MLHSIRDAQLAHLLNARTFNCSAPSLYMFMVEHVVNNAWHVGVMLIDLAPIIHNANTGKPTCFFFEPHDSQFIGPFHTLPNCVLQIATMLNIDTIHLVCGQQRLPNDNHCVAHALAFMLGVCCGELPSPVHHDVAVRNFLILAWINLYR